MNWTYFNQNNFPNKLEIRKLSLTLGLQYEFVSQWFLNKKTILLETKKSLVKCLKIGKKLISIKNALILF